MCKFKGIWELSGGYDAYDSFQIWLFAVEDEVEKVMPIFKVAAEAFNGKVITRDSLSLYIYAQLQRSWSLADCDFYIEAAFCIYPNGS